MVGCCEDGNESSGSVNEENSVSRLAEDLLTSQEGLVHSRYVK